MIVNPDSWYDIPGFDGKYQINYHGDLRRTLKMGGHKMLHPYIKHSNGRRVVKLNGKEYVVMKLMQLTFFGSLEDGMVNYHKNGLKTDDCLPNIGRVARCDIGKITGTTNGREFQIAKINQDGEIVEFYKSAREAGRKNYMAYQTILDRVNGRVKSLYAPDGFVYVLDKDRAIEKAIRRIELDNKEKCGVTFVKATEVIFDF